ncbi:PP2C family protein-serine/threonine phosphatase [Leptolyngbya sp. AN02str]|uniref:PP2C family protein-serine/threonine phosphatase n=1 Tax=Leptolyngbya sp. AN02str TaxID=3423363 RepID=UPI003D30FF32
MPQILIIDDDPTMQIILMKALKEEGYEVNVASDGAEGLELAHQIRPDLVICDWVMPRIDGLEVCRQIKASPKLSTTFFILLTARGGVEDRVKGLDNGADDFLAKPIEILELQARVRAGLRLHQLSEDLQAQKQLLEKELTEAASYVRSILPEPLSGNLKIDSRFIPSSQLGGDCYDYYWLDPDYLTVYLLDVSGHGLGAALPSITILNLLRSQSLPSVNFYQPNTVLRALNETFQMDDQNDKYFTIWYGVYNRVKRQLIYSTAGHPPAVLVTETPSGVQVEQLKTPGMPIGMMPDESYFSARCDIPLNSTLYIFSDGIYDVPAQEIANGWGFNQFVEVLRDAKNALSLDELLDRIRTLTGTHTFGDDLSLLRIQFD